MITPEEIETIQHHALDPAAKWDILLAQSDRLTLLRTVQWLMDAHLQLCTSLSSTVADRDHWRNLAEQLADAAESGGTHGRR